jgi:hypothetical protein
MNSDCYTQSEKPSRGKGFRKNVSELLMHRDVGNVDGAIGLMLPEDVKRDINMFGFLMLLRVMNKANCRLVIRNNGVGLSCG